MIKSTDLENRSADSIATAEAEIRRLRGKTAPSEVNLDPKALIPTAADRELAALKARLEAARTLPPPRDAYDGAMWARGRDAAIAAIEGTEG